MSDLPSFPGPSLYLFAGSDTTTQPVDLSTYVAADRDSADTSYCKSNGTVASVAISAGRTISYGITAVNGVFEQAMRALSSVANATGTPDIETLQSISLAPS